VAGHSVSFQEGYHHKYRKLRIYPLQLVSH